MEFTNVILTKAWDFWQLAILSLGFFQILEFLVHGLQTLHFFPATERGVGGVGLPFCFCLLLNLCFLLIFSKVSNENINSVMK
jgi:hypothetical protein